MNNIFKIAMISVFLITTTQISSQSIEISKDKIQHYAWGTAAGIPTYFIYKDKLNFSSLQSISLTATTSLVTAWGFEHLQKTTGSGVYDNYDILATVLGAITGAILANIIEYKPDRYRNKMFRKQKRLENKLKRKTQ